MPGPASKFLCLGLQEWGQSEHVRRTAIDEFLTAAGFRLPKDRAVADQWLKNVQSLLKRGKFEDEIEQLNQFIELHKAGMAAQNA